MLIDALSFLVALAPILGVRRAYNGGPRASRSPTDWRALRRELADGIRYLAATRVLFTLLVSMLVLNLCLGADKLIIAGSLTLLTVAVGWFAGLRREQLPVSVLAS